MRGLVAAGASWCVLVARCASGPPRWNLVAVGLGRGGCHARTIARCELVSGDVRCARQVWRRRCLSVASASVRSGRPARRGGSRSRCRCVRHRLHACWVVVAGVFLTAASSCGRNGHADPPQRTETPPPPGGPNPTRTGSIWPCAANISGPLRDLVARRHSHPKCRILRFPRQNSCRRRDSNPRHADYDSAALTD